MTTIVTDGKVMAGDTMCGGELFHTNLRKVHRVKDGSIIGSAGTAFDNAGFLAWADSGGDLQVTERFEGLILRPDGRIMCVNDKGLTFEHEAPACVGSGSAVAYGALEFGATPAQAVAAAIKRDAFTGGTIMVEALA